MVLSLDKMWAMLWLALALLGFVVLWRLCTRLRAFLSLRKARRLLQCLDDPEREARALEDLRQLRPATAADRAIWEEANKLGPASAPARMLLARSGFFERRAHDLKRGSFDRKTRAVSFFAKVADDFSQRQLIEALGDDHPSIAEAAAQALAKLEPATVVSLLATALGSEHRRVAETAAALLAHSGVQALDSLLLTLESENPQVRRLACDALGVIGEDVALAAIRSLLERDPDADVRAAAAQALGRFGAEEGYRALQQTVRNDPDWFVQVRAVNSLVEARAPGSIDFLVGLLEEGELWDGFLPREQPLPEERPLSVDTILSPRERLRQAINLGLHDLGEEPPAHVPESSLTRQSSFDDEQKRELGLLSQNVSHPDPEIRAKALSLLASRAGHSATALLLERLGDPEPLVRAKAAALLAEVGGRDALDPLTAALKDPNPEVRRASAEAIQALILRDTSPSVFRPFE